MRIKCLFALIIALVIAPIAHAQQGPPPIMPASILSLIGSPDPVMPELSEYRMPEIYVEWAREVAACEGLPFPEAKFRQVQFFQINASAFFMPDDYSGTYAVTFATAYKGQVFVSYPLIWSQEIIGHESLHLLLYWAGFPDWYKHDEQRFTSCGLHVFGPPLKP